MFLAKKLNKGAGTPPPLVDAQFNYVTMLLHGDGTNGAQNNTFVDSGPNTFSITRGGNTTQGSFSPYGDKWSNYFDGTGSYLSLLSNSSLNFGTGDFTIECWLNINTLNGGVLVDFRPASTNGDYPLIYQSGSGLDFYASGGAQISSGTITTKTWFHFALCRSGSSMKMFFNGTQTGSTYTASVNYSVGSTLGIGTSTFALGSSIFDGYISNLRVLKGTALYTTTFTPPTTPLTAITNTSLLTCQSNRFIDNSTNVFALTVGGTPSVQRFNPFGASTAYSTSVIGGSGYFDGSGDYLSGPTSNSAFQFGTGDFTVEAWVYQTVDNTYPSILEIGDHLSATGILFIKYGISSAIYSGGFYGASATTMNGWNHIAYVRSSGSLKIYVNGVSPAGVTFTNNLTNSNKVTIGVDQNLSAGYYFSGNISNLRVVKGTAVYTANFTPPTTPLTAISGTSLLMPMTNAAIIDNAMMNNLETLGNSQISTSVKKYGTGSMAFDGTGDWLLSTTAQNIGFRTGDFTVEFWINPTNWSATYAGVIAGITNNSLWIGKNASNFVLRAANNTDLVSYGTMPTTGTWTHIAITRSGTTARMFYDGTQVASATTGNDFVDGAFYIGQDGGSNAFTGYLDDFRITKGYARYTANFTAPTAAFLDTGPN